MGKGLSGGTIVVKLATSSKLNSNENTIIGNTVLYGATEGKLFASGQAGELFGVRNSGASAVVEGCGSNGCEYMTGGLAVILGGVGDNFGAGMTGGMAFVYDNEDNFETRVNSDTVIWQRINSGYWGNICKDLIEEHVNESGSRFSKQLLANWDLESEKIWQVCPKEMLDKLIYPLSDDEQKKVKST